MNTISTRIRIRAAIVLVSTVAALCYGAAACWRAFDGQDVTAFGISFFLILGLGATALRLLFHFRSIRSEMAEFLATIFTGVVAIVLVSLAVDSIPKWLGYNPIDPASYDSHAGLVVGFMLYCLLYMPIVLPLLWFFHAWRDVLSSVFPESVAVHKDRRPTPPQRGVQGHNS